MPISGIEGTGLPAFTSYAGGRLALLLAVTLVSSSCLLKAPKRFLGKNYLQIQVINSPGANGNSPVAFDVVMVNDKDLAKKLADLTAAQWFQQRDQFQRDYPNQRDLAVRSWEWVPGQSVGELKLRYRAAPRAALAFANYFTPGAHRVRLTTDKPVEIVLGDAEVAVQAAHN